MSALLSRIGGFAAVHPWRVVTAWLVVLAAAVGLSLAVGGQPKDDYRVAGSPSQAGSDFVEQHFPGPTEPRPGSSSRTGPGGWTRPNWVLFGPGCGRSRT